MSGLPTQIPIQSLPFVQKGQDGEMYVEFNWYLFLYNLAQKVFGTGSNTTPVSPSDLLDINALFAQEADIPQAFRGLRNAAALEAQGMMIVGADVPQAFAGLRNAAAREAQGEAIAGADLQRVNRDIANLRALFGLALPEPKPVAQPTQTITVGASPFTWTAPFSGTLSVTGGTVSAISIIRQGVTVATGITVGLIPVSRSDQVMITYTGLPTVVFLPS